jgi:hypothetical protein
VAEPVAGLSCSWHRTRAKIVALPLPCNGLQWRWLALPLGFSGVQQIMFLLGLSGQWIYTSNSRELACSAILLIIEIPLHLLNCNVVFNS